MYCTECQHYINGEKAKVQHQLRDKCMGLKHIFDAKDVKVERPKPVYNRRWRNK